MICVIPYEDDDDAVRIANDSIYGLSGSDLIARSDERALAVGAAHPQRNPRIERRLSGSTPDTPFGGYKQSGLGRENGTAGFEEYLETKVIALPVRDA